MLGHYQTDYGDGWEGDEHGDEGGVLACIGDDFSGLRTVKHMGETDLSFSNLSFSSFGLECAVFLCLLPNK